MVLSCAEDRTARIWDLRARQATGVMKDCKVNPTAAFDYQGMIFAVSSVPGAIKVTHLRLDAPTSLTVAALFCHLPYSLLHSLPC